MGVWYNLSWVGWVMKGLIYWDTSPFSSTFTVLIHRGEFNNVNKFDDSVQLSYLTIIPRARMGSESIAHEADGRMGY